MEGKYYKGHKAILGHDGCFIMLIMMMVYQVYIFQILSKFCTLCMVYYMSIISQ